MFEFEDAMAYGGFYVEYAPSPDALDDAGSVAPERRKSADIVLSFHGTGTSEGVHPDFGRRSSTGRGRVRPRGTKEIVEAVFSCEFEAMVEWLLVIRQWRPFRVTTLIGPPRVVVDVERRR